MGGRRLVADAIREHTLAITIVQDQHTLLAAAEGIVVKTHLWAQLACPVDDHAPTEVRTDAAGDSVLF